MPELYFLERFYWLLTHNIMESVDITFELRSRLQEKVQAFIDNVSQQLVSLQSSMPISYENRIAQGTLGFRLDPRSELLSTFASCCAQQGLEVQFNDGVGGSDAIFSIRTAARI